MGARVAKNIASASTADGHASACHPRRTRVSSRSLPRIAAVGGTWLASRAGTTAATSDSGTPIANASSTCAHVRSGGAAAVVM